MGRLDGKVAVITGASTGIGRATLEGFAADGASVVGGARTQATLDEALASALSRGGRGIVVAGDLSTDTGNQALIDATIAEFGRIDILVNNAGVGWAYGAANPGAMNGLHDTTNEWWDTVMAINLNSYFYASRAALQHMIEQGSGSIVHVASMGGITGLYDSHTYTAAKGAVVNLTRSMAITYIKNGVRTNAVCPGFVDTPMIEGVIPAFADPVVGNALTPIGRPAAPSEIAAANLFLASDDASYCNGSILVVDGGCTARSFPG